MCLPSGVFIHFAILQNYKKFNNNKQIITTKTIKQHPKTEKIYVGTTHT
jgi:hypothetical protein